MKLNQTTYRFQTHILAICIRRQRGNYIYMRLRKNLRKCGLVNKFNYCMQEVNFYGPIKIDTG